MLNLPLLSHFPPFITHKQTSQHHIYFSFTCIATSTMTQTFLVFGATGMQGGGTAHLLLAQNYKVHALVRTPASPASLKLKENGAVLFKGDYDNLPSIKEALQGVTGVFLIVNPTPTQVEQTQAIVNLIQEVKTVTTVILSTTFLTGSPEKWGKSENPMLQWYFTGKLGQEEACKKAGFQNLTILRPGFLQSDYYDTNAAMNYPQLPAENILAHAYNKTATMPHLAEGDVGKFAFAALTEPEKFRGEEIELASESLTIAETLEKLKSSTGRDIKERKLSEEEVGTMMGSGVMGLMFHAFANDVDLYIDGKALEKKYGIPLVGFEEYHKSRLA